MGRFKLRPPSRLEVRLAAASARGRGFEAQMSGYDPLLPGIETRDTPPGMVPASAIVTELFKPYLPEHVDEDTHAYLSSLANLAAAVWSVSRFERDLDPDAEQRAEQLWSSILKLSDGTQDMAEEMLTRARTMYPDDTRSIVATRVTRRGNNWDVTATTVTL